MSHAQRAFLSAVLPMGGAYYVTRNAPPSTGEATGAWAQRSLSTSAGVLADIEQRHNSSETYVALAAFDPDGRRTKDAVVAKGFISADIDDKVMPGTDAEQQHQSARRLATVSELRDTTIVVDSGGGFHVHLKLPDGHRVEDFADRAAGRRHVERLSIGFRQWLEAKAQALFGQGVLLDHTHTIERVWRVPGTFNCKAPGREKLLTGDRNQWRPVRLLREPDSLAGITPATEEFVATLLRQAPPQTEPANTTVAASVGDDDIFAKIAAEPNGASHTRLLAGDTSGYKSHSEADLAACSKLAFYAGPDSNRIDQLFRATALMRPKWDELHGGGRTYGELTIAKAIEGRVEFYGNGRAPPGTRSAPSNPGIGVTKSVADEILGSHAYAQDEGNKLYVFRHGVYRPDGEQHVKRAVKRILLERNKDASWNTKRANEIVEFIRVDARHLWPCPPTDTLNVANGLLDLSTRKVRHHEPDFLSPVQLPVAFDANAKCPMWERFVETTFPHDAQSIAWEIPAVLVVPGLRQKTAVLLIGVGDNGKSVYSGGLTSFVGRGNISAISLHQLERSRFASAGLLGKLANICADLAAEQLKGTSIFKGITGGDRMQAERKYRDAFEFQPFARLVFSANALPRSPDASEAYFRRWLIVPFDRVFEGSERIERHVLDAQLANPHELSGVLNRALEVLPGVIANGYTTPPSVVAASEEFRRIADPVAIWLEQHVVVGADAFVAKHALVDAYRQYAEEKNVPAVTGAAMGRQVLGHYPQVEEKQRMVGDKLSWCWIGIKLRRPR